MKMAILELEYKNIRKITALKLPFTKADGSVISNNFIMMANGKLEQIMLQYISNNDTLLSEDGIKTLNAYALKGYRLITDYPLFDKPTSREEFLDAFNVAMQFYEKKDS